MLIGVTGGLQNYSWSNAKFKGRYS